MKKNKYNTMTMYTVQRINNKDQLFGAVHGSSDCEKTACGRELDTGWYVLSNCFDNEITCKKCLKEIERKINNCEPL
jgi:hypothetical protein